MRRSIRRELTAALLAPLLAAAAAAAPADGGEILAVDLERFEAMVAGDLPALDRLLAEELTYTHSDGRVESKEEFLAALASGALDYLSIEREEVVERRYGEAAVLNGVAAVRVAAGEQRVEVRLRFTSVYVRREGAWRLAAWQSTSLR